MMIEAYLMHEKERNAQGIPALPLTPEQTTGLCELLPNPPASKEEFLMNLFTERVSPGVDPAAEIKAGFLAEILTGAKSSPLIDKKRAVQILGTMIGGYNVQPLIGALSDSALADDAVAALSGMTYVYDAADQVIELSKNNAAAKKVVESWAAAEWFTNKPVLNEIIKVKVFKVEGEINTDDFSPAGGYRRNRQVAC
jgi:aconitate hydratase 2/2-methylisocitrate dehydratase